MKPNFETGRVEMTEPEFRQLYGYAYWTNTGYAAENFADMKRAYRDFLTVCHEQTDDGDFHVSVNADGQTWILDEHAVGYALNKLSLVSGRLANLIRTERWPGYQGGKMDLSTRPYNAEHERATSLALGISMYLDLLGCTLELEAHQTQQPNEGNI